MEELVVMRKSTTIDAAVMDEIRSRRSLRAYAATTVAEEDIRSLFEAARWAPSSMNEQPWTYIYATKESQPELWNDIASVLNESNRVWAAAAPLFIVSLVRRNLLRNNLPNGSARYDLGAANAFLSLQAAHLGLNIHQMGGFDREKARQVLNVPETHDFGVIMAVGYPGQPDVLPENLKQRELAPRERYEQDEFVMNKRF